MKAKILLSITVLLLNCVIYGKSAPLIRRPTHKYNKIPILAPSKSIRSGAMSIAGLTRNLQFGFSQAEVEEGYSAQLDQLATLLSKGNYAIALRGHADSIGTYVGNWKLSEKRAIAVKDYLLSKGIPEDKIVTTPFGSTVPIASNKTKEGRKKNRRVEIRLQQLPALSAVR